jgi:hypothetical protein
MAAIDGAPAAELLEGEAEHARLFARLVAPVGSGCDLPSVLDKAA